MKMAIKWGLVAMGIHLFVDIVPDAFLSFSIYENIGRAFIGSILLIIQYLGFIYELPFIGCQIAFHFAPVYLSVSPGGPS